MTLCIAAACKEGHEPRIVLCTDELVSTAVSSSETEFKLIELPRFIAMYSGLISEAREVLTIYEQQLLEQESDKLLTNLSAHEWLEKLRKPLRIRRRSQIEHMIAERTGLTHKEFMDRFDKLSSVYEKIQEDMVSKASEVELLIAGFIKESSAFEHPLIARVRMGNAEVHTNFACIGVGAEAAEQSLHRREQNDLNTLYETLYHVYEAKRMGEQSPQVGKRTSMLVLARRTEDDQPNFHGSMVKPAGINHFEELYRRYGPQPTDTLKAPPTEIDMHPFYN